MTSQVAHVGRMDDTDGTLLQTTWTHVDELMTDDLRVLKPSPMSKYP